MCGIAGLILSSGATPPDPTTLSRLIDSLHHRGPDGTGHAVVGRVALVHNRLAIIDLVTGDQPLFAGPATLVCNGEIYNYRELRVAMPGRRLRHQQRLRAATAFVAARRRGLCPAPARHVAIAIHERAPADGDADPRSVRHQAAVPGAGRTAGWRSPRSRRRCWRRGWSPREVRPAAREELLQLQFTTGTDTIFEGIQRLLPGETLTCADGHVIDRRRISRLPEGGPENIDEDEALARLDRALEESVDLHQRSDVPYGMFLSGGIDSSTLLALMARLNSQPVLAFTAGFDAPGAADEREHAATVAKALGARHETIEIDETMVWRHLPEIVALHGRSGGGLRDHPDLVPGAAGAAGCKGGAERRGGRRDLRRLSPLPQRDEALVAGRTRDVGTRQFRPRRCAALTACVLARRHRRGRDRGGGERPVAAGGGAGHRHGRLAAARPAAEAGSLPDGARGGRTHAVSRPRRGGRGIPAAGCDEAARRRWASGSCASGWRSICRWRGRSRRSRGSPCPWASGSRGRATRLGPLVAAQPGIVEIAEPAKVRTLFGGIRRWRHGFACWKLLFYALWHRRHILGLPPAGDVFETLAAT